MTKISFLIPLFNEIYNIEETVKIVTSAALKLGISYEVIIIDDYSSDGSYEKAVELQKKFSNLKLYKNEQNLGFAQTYMKCITKAEGSFCQYIPSDNVIRFDDLIKLLSKLGEYEVILQYCKNPHKRVCYRYYISEGYTYLLNRANYQKIRYYNGLNIYPTGFLKTQVTQEQSFAFQAKIVMNAIKKYEYVEIPTNCINKDSTSTALTLRNAFGVIKFLIQEVFHNENS